MKVYYIFAILLFVISCKSKSLVNKKIPFEYDKTIQIPQKNIDNLSEEKLNEIIAKIDTAFNKKVDSAGFNGCILVAYKGVPIYRNAHGYEDLAVKRPLKINSIFQIASTSKTFTSSAILYLYDKKLLSLEDTLGKYFKNFPYPNITIKDLLSHRSGLPNYLHFLNEYGYDTMSLLSNKKLLQILYAKNPELLAPPNFKFAYNNTNYALLALIVEQISKMSFPVFMQKVFFDPIGMKNTFIYTPDMKLKKIITLGYLRRGVLDTIAPTDGIYGDKNVYSTVDDLLLWDQALKTGKLISNATINEAYIPRSNEKPGIKNYGYGWRLLQQNDSSYLVFHNGWWHGFTSAFYRNLQNDITIICLSNMFNRSTYKVQEIWEAILGEKLVEDKE